jgi:hypothetical protein
MVRDPSPVIDQICRRGRRGAISSLTVGAPRAGHPLVDRLSFWSRSATTSSVAGERLPYHQIAQTRRARCDRGKCRAEFVSARKTSLLDSRKVPELTEEFAKQKSQKHETGQILSSWRREWDSNPRYGFPYTRFPSVRLKPLGHPSPPRHQRQYNRVRSCDNREEARCWHRW